MSNYQTVCFIGHRKIPVSPALTANLTQVITDLVTHGADTFLFGSRSQFNDLCWTIVTQLKKQFPAIKRVGYHTPHETVLPSRAAAIRLAQLVHQPDRHYPYYDAAVASPHGYKQTYIARNQSMIDHSDLCVCYYDPAYRPPRRHRQQAQSGTALAYAYAKRQGKVIINVYLQQTIYSA